MNAEARARAAFLSNFGSEPAVVARSPGRVNLIGEHTDYNDGLALPMPIAQELVVCARPRNDSVLQVTALDRKGTAKAAAQGAETRTIDLPVTRIPAGGSAYQPGWVSYVAGVAALLDLRQGAELVLASDIPEGAGLSSSAALEAALAHCLLTLQNRTLPAEQMARLCRQAETEYAGVQCGIMDPYAVLIGRKGHALLLDCRSLTYEHVPIPPAARILLRDSGASRALAASAYNTRVRECREAAHLLGVPSLRDVEVVSATDALPEPLRRRARHVVSENERVRAFVSALRAGDLRRCGHLLDESHESLRTDYEVTSPGLDALAEAMRRQPGVYGARMTGAGFGGYIIVLSDSAVELRHSGAV